MLFDMYKNGHEASNPLLLMIIKAIAEKHPKNVADFFSQLCDSSIFKPDSLNLRGSIIACIGAINEVLNFVCKTKFQDPLKTSNT